MGRATGFIPHDRHRDGPLITCGNGLGIVRSEDDPGWPHVFEPLCGERTGDALQLAVRQPSQGEQGGHFDRLSPRVLRNRSGKGIGLVAMAAPRSPI